MLSFGIGATFTLFIINYTATIINVLFAFTAFTPSQFTSNSLIVVNQEEEKEYISLFKEQAVVEDFKLAKEVYQADESESDMTESILVFRMTELIHHFMSRKDTKDGFTFRSCACLSTATGDGKQDFSMVAIHSIILSDRHWLIFRDRAGHTN